MVTLMWRGYSRPFVVPEEAILLRRAMDLFLAHLLVFVVGVREPDVERSVSSVLNHADMYRGLNILSIDERSTGHPKYTISSLLAFFPPVRPRQMAEAYGTHYILLLIVMRCSMS